MDVLLSLPIVSYFLAPTVTSWSTSLNLLFFYMTWTTLVLSHSPLRIELFGTLGLRIFLWFIPSIAFLLFDTLLPSLAESIKFGGSAALPPRDAKRLGKILLLSIINLALETALEAGTSIGLTLLVGHPIFRTTTTLPLPFQIIKQIGLLIVSREVLTYYIHRTILHTHKTGRGSDSWGSSLARLHGAYAHSRRGAPFSLSLGADHPLTFLLHRFVPVYLPALAIRPHLLTYFLFVGLITIEETMSMSGYSIVPGIIMGGIARRTAWHYGKGGGPNSGNYGAWGLMDWVHGTTLGKDVMSDVKDEAEKHHVKEKGEEAADNAAGILQDGIETLRQKSKSRRGKKNKQDDN